MTAATCPTCGGDKRVQASCPDGRRGCLVAHSKTCPACAGTGRTPETPGPFAIPLAGDDRVLVAGDSMGDSPKGSILGPAPVVAMTSPTHLPSETVDDEGLITAMLAAYEAVDDQAYARDSEREQMRAALRVVRAETPKARGARERAHALLATSEACEMPLDSDEHWYVCDNITAELQRCDDLFTAALKMRDKYKQRLSDNQERFMMYDNVKAQRDAFQVLARDAAGLLEKIDEALMEGAHIVGRQAIAEWLARYRESVK